MAASRWTQRVRTHSARQELQEVRDAARDLADQGRHTPGKAPLVFQTVADIAVIGTAVISGVLATIHLCKALSRPQRDKHDRNAPESHGAERSPPGNRGSYAVSHDANEGEGHHNRRAAVAGHRHSFDSKAEKQR